MNEKARAAILAALNHKTEYRHQLAAILRKFAIDMPECETAVAVRVTSYGNVTLYVIEHNGVTLLDDRTYCITSYDPHDRKYELFDWMNNDISILAEALSMTEYEVMKGAAEHFDLRPGEVPDFWMCKEWAYSRDDLKEDLFRAHEAEVMRYSLDYFDLAEFLIDQTIKDLTEEGGEEE